MYITEPIIGFNYGDFVYIIDPSTYSEIGSIQLPLNSEPTGITFVPTANDGPFTSRMNNLTM